MYHLCCNSTKERWEILNRKNEIFFMGNFNDCKKALSLIKGFLNEY